MKRNPAAQLRARLGAATATLLSGSLLTMQLFLLMLLVGIPGQVWAQDSGGKAESAIRAPLASRSLLLDSARAGGAIVLVGERGHILVSNDSGQKWVQAEVPTRSLLTAVYFHDQKLGWAVGHDAVILRTRDGGVTWERVHYAPEDETPFLDVRFVDASKGFAVGAYGRCYVTADGGTSWNEARVSDEDFHLNQIAAAANGRLYIAAESGHVFRSDDGGETWKALDTSYQGSFFGVLPLENDSVLLFGLRGHLYRSDDAGETWSPLETGTASLLNSGIRLADGTVIVVGLGGTVLVSRDGGRSFVPRQQSTRGGIQSVTDGGDGHLVLTGEFGVRRVPVAELAK